MPSLPMFNDQQKGTLGMKMGKETDADIFKGLYSSSYLIYPPPLPPPKATYHPTACGPARIQCQPTLKSPPHQL